MLIKLEVLEAIRRGEITLQFRRWSRPSVKPGGTLKSKVGLLRIGRIDDMRPEDVTDADARRAGFKDVAEFNRWLGTMKQGPLFQRIEISWLGDSESSASPGHLLSPVVGNHCSQLVISPGAGNSPAGAALLDTTQREDPMVHKDEVKGGAKQARGTAKEAIGKVTGDKKLQADGALDKAEGKVQQGVGKAKEKVRDALKK